MLETHVTFKNFQGQSPFQNGRIRNFQSFAYEYVVCCAKKRTDLMLMLVLPRLGSYFMMIHHFLNYHVTFYASIILSILKYMLNGVFLLA